MTSSITRFHSALRRGNHTPETLLPLLWVVSHCFSTRGRQSNFTVIRRVIRRIYQYVLQDLESNSWITVCCQHGHLSFSRGLCDAAVTLEVAGLRWEVLNEVTLCAHLTTHTRWLHKENVTLVLSTSQPQHQSTLAGLLSPPVERHYVNLTDGLSCVSSAQALVWVFADKVNLKLGWGSLKW